MAIVVRYSPSNLKKEQYDQVNEKLGASGLFKKDEMPDGMVMHVLFGDEGNLKISEIWESREQWQAFGEKLNPVLEEAGAQTEGPPDVFEVVNLAKA